VLEAEGDLGNMTSDVTKLRQTLFNLIGNANKFTENGTITVRATRTVREAQDWIRIDVDDTGIGLSPNQVQRLFRPFTQADASTTRKYGGTGLGLTISKHFCQMMDGFIEVASEPGKGSCFTVHLPAEVSAPASSQKPSPRGAGHDKGRVLVIDDDPAIRDLLARTLGKRGFQVETAPDGPAGIERAAAAPPDVVVLDVLMPGMDGWNVIAELKRRPETAEIPVVILTILEQANVGFSLGAADFVLKPIVPDRIAQVVSRHCRRHRGRVLVVEADNGRTALERLDDVHPDAIVLDLLMPEVDGFTFLEELRNRGHDIPVIVATAKELTGAERAMLESRVQEILKKGDYPRDALLEALSSSLTAAAATRGSVRPQASAE
jgi:CheY-like chemotaxis protein